MILGCEPGDRAGEIAGEPRTCGGVGEADLGLQGERGNAAATGFAAGALTGDLLDHLRRHRDEIGAREPVGDLCRVRGDGAERGRADEIGAGDGTKQPLGAASPLPHADFFDEALLLQQPEMVVELLPRLAQPPGETGRGVRLGELAEQPQPQRMEEGGSGLGVVDDVEWLGGGGHGPTVHWTKIFVNSPTLAAPIDCRYALRMFPLRSLVLCAAAAATPVLVRAQNLPPQAHQQLAREILAQLIAIRTTDSVGATPAAEALAVRFKASGFPAADIQLVGPHPAHQNIVVRFRGDGTGGKPILFISHLDVVEAKREDWSLDPFALTERDGWFFGRGTYDIKDEVADLTANFIRLKQEGFTPTRDLILAFTDGEEGGDYNGAEWLLANRRSLVEAEFVINTDAAGGQTKNGRHTWNPVQTSEKLYVTYVLEVTNPGGHSSEPVPDNAIYRLAAGLQRLSRYDFPVQLTETTRGYFRTVAKQEQGQVAADMLAITRTPPDPKAAARLGASSPYYHAMMRNTCVATMLQAGDQENALPQRARATIQCRLLPGVDPERIRRTLAGVVADTAISVTLANTPQPSPASPIRPDLMGTIQRITSEMWPGTLVLPVMDPWSSDGALFRQAGFPTYGLSAVFADVDSVTSHGKDERVGVKEFYEGVEFMYRLIRTLGSAKGSS